MVQLDLIMCLPHTVLITSLDESNVFAVIMVPEKKNSDFVWRST